VVIPITAVVESPRAKIRALIAGCLRREPVRTVRTTAGGGGVGVFIVGGRSGSFMINRHPRRGRAHRLHDRRLCLPKMELWALWDLPLE